MVKNSSLPDKPSCALQSSVAAASSPPARPLAAGRSCWDHRRTPVTRLFHSRQGGVSLVEIMVSLVTSMILIAGILQFYLSNKQTYRVIDTTSRIQENARFAMEIVGRHLRMTGYRINTASDPATVFPQLSLGGYTLAAGETIHGSDTDVVIRYQGDGVIEDCASTAVIAAGTVVAVHFSLAGDNTLQCQTTPGGQTASLVSGVNRLRFLYGVDTDGDGSANCYDRANALNGANPTACGKALDEAWKHVVGMRIDLGLQTTENLSSVTGNQPFGEPFSSTISFRNTLQ